MSCPTCDHTMESLGGGEALYWCPRCGTLKHGSYPFEAVPKLVSACRSFWTDCCIDLSDPSAQTVENAWRNSGIHEAINKPEDRP
jgi:hypothetical protein